MKFNVNIKISAEDQEYIKRMLNEDEKDDKMGTLMTHTGCCQEDSDIEVDLKLVNTEEGPYLDIILFDDGYEMQCLDPMYELRSEYFFEQNKDVYIVKII